MKTIQLTKGFEAIVDENIYDELIKFKWHYNSGYAICDRRRSKKDHEFHGKQILMHRLIMIMNGHELTGKYVDHINGNRLDNRYCNLRECSSAQNSFNTYKKSKNSNSVYKGLIIDKRKPNAKNKWGIQIKINYKSNHIGFVDNEILAAKIYDSVARYYHKEFARTNFENHNLNPMSIQEAKQFIKQLKKKNYGR